MPAGGGGAPPRLKSPTATVQLDIAAAPQTFCSSVCASGSL